MRGSINVGAQAGYGLRAHNLDLAAHPDLRVALSELASRVALLEMRGAAGGAEQSFRVTFEAPLEAASVTGTWNEPLARVEF